MKARATPRKRELVAVPTTFYLGSLDGYVRGHLKSSAEYFASQSTTVFTLDHVGAEAQLEGAELDVAEALMLGDGVALTVTGDNAVLAYLTRMFGVHATSELMRTHVIEFVAESHAPVFAVDPSAVRQADGSPAPPENPVSATINWASQEPKLFASGSFDAEAAATIALRRFERELGIDRRDIGELSRRAAKCTHVVPHDRVQNITSRVGAAYAAGNLESLGLSPKIAHDTNTYQNRSIVDLVARVLRTENLLDFELDQYQMPEQWADVLRFTSEVASGDHVLRSVDKVMELRRAADLRALFRDRVLKIEDIPKLRDHPATRAFRRWLWSQPDPADADAVVEGFLRSVTAADRTTVASYMRSGAMIAGIIVSQELALDALRVPPELRLTADAIVGTAAHLLSDTALEKFRKRPPSAFFDQIIDPALHAAAKAT